MKASLPRSNSRSGRVGSLGGRATRGGSLEAFSVGSLDLETAAVMAAAAVQVTGAAPDRRRTAEEATPDGGINTAPWNDEDEARCSVYAVSSPFVSCD